MKKFLHLFSALAIVLSLAMAFAPASYAQDNLKDEATSKESSKKVCPANTTCLDNPLGEGVNTPQQVIKNVLTGVLGIVGSLALLMFVYGGFTLMLAGGNAENVKKGRDILMWAAIGLVVIFTSYAMVDFVITTIRK